MLNGYLAEIGTDEEGSTRDVMIADRRDPIDGKGEE
jgi:hypothetical protein